MVRDPVCGMMVDPQTANFKSEYNDQTYYFCSSGCKRAFDAQPMKFSSKVYPASTPPKPMATPEEDSGKPEEKS